MHQIPRKRPIAVPTATAAQHLPREHRASYAAGEVFATQRNLHGWVEASNQLDTAQSWQLHKKPELQSRLPVGSRTILRQAPSWTMLPTLRSFALPGTPHKRGCLVTGCSPWRSSRRIAVRFRRPGQGLASVFVRNCEYAPHLKHHSIGPCLRSRCPRK